LLITALLLALIVATAAAPRVGAAPDDKPAAPTALFTCTQHGPNMMTLTLTLETGKGGRTVLLTGANETKAWKITVDGKDVLTKEQAPDGKATLAVQPTDKITWRVVNLRHGVTFADRKAAEALLEFQTKEGKELTDRKEDKFKTFGPSPWGTDPFPGTEAQP